MRKKLLFAILFLITLSEHIFADTFFKKLIPDHSKIQYAGNIGFFAIGLGYNFAEIYDLDVMYGYTPGYIGGHHINQLTIKNTIIPKMHFNLGKIRVNPLLGLHFTYNMRENRNTWLKLPDRYPGGYYFPTALHGLLTAGIRVDSEEIKSNFFENLALYFELGTVDSYLRSYFISKNIPFYEIWNISLSLRFDF